MVFRKAMRQVLHYWFMYPAGLSIIIREVFAAALLNSMPMGFFQPAQIVIDAQKHTVEIREIDVNYSVWDNKLEGTSGKYIALGLGFRKINGIRE